MSRCGSATGRRRTGWPAGRGRCSGSMCRVGRRRGCGRRRRTRRGWRTAPAPRPGPAACSRLPPRGLATSVSTRGGPNHTVSSGDQPFGQASSARVTTDGIGSPLGTSRSARIAPVLSNVPKHSPATGMSSMISGSASIRLRDLQASAVKRIEVAGGPEWRATHSYRLISNLPHRVNVTSIRLSLTELHQAMSSALAAYFSVRTPEVTEMLEFYDRPSSAQRLPFSTGTVAQHGAAPIQPSLPSFLV